MSVPGAIIVGSVIIAGAIFLMRVPLFSLQPHETNSYIRFNVTTGSASVCSIGVIDREYVWMCTPARDITHNQAGLK